jgi:hypothetical protein
VKLLLIIDKSLAKGERNSMLKDLGVLIKVGQHANIAGIIGVCEEPGNKSNQYRAIIFYLYK